MLALNKARLRAIAFIAAVLAIGGFFGARSLFAETKPMVNEKLLTTMWFNVDVSDADDPDDPSESEQIITSEGNTDAECSEPEGTLCAVRLQYDEQNQDIINLLAEIDGPNPPSIADLLATEAASPPSSASGPNFTYKEE